MTDLLPPINHTHEAYNLAAEILCCLTPTVPVSLHAIGKTLNVADTKVLSTINELRERGYLIHTTTSGRANGGLAARVLAHGWERVLDAGGRYWAQVYDDWPGEPRDIGSTLYDPNRRESA